MKKYVYLLSVFAICILAYPIMQVKMAADETTYYEKVEDSYGVNGGKFKVNGIWAYCADCNKNAVPKGTAIESIKKSTNENLRKVLWYGSIGPGAIIDNDDSGWIQTAQAVSQAMGNGTVNSRYKSWYEDVIKKEAPPSGFAAYIATPENSSLQPLAYFVYEPIGKAQLKKTSSNQDTEGNSNYSLEGAKYGVYKEKACTTKVGTFETDSDGKSNILKLEPKTYYVKETAAPKGYALSTTVSKMVVKEDETITLSVEDTPIKGKLQLIKLSANTGTTSGNACYSLEGAEYGVYKEKACTTKVATLKTGSNGKSSTVSLLANTYYIKETKAPKGYVKDGTVYTAKVTAADSVTVKVNVKDQPQLDTIDVILKKVDAGTEDNKSTHSGTLKGAQYAVQYYDVLLEDAELDPAITRAEPKMIWILETDENGYLHLNNTYKVSGDAFYRDSAGQPGFPIGTVTLQEIKAPEGYLLNSEVYVRQITIKGNAEDVNSYNCPVAKEQVLRVNLLKLQEDTDVPIPGTVFEHIRPDGTVEKLATDESGSLSFEGLQYGNHIIREKEVMEGYLINENDICFCVGTDNDIQLTNEIDHSKGDIEFLVTEEGNVSIVMYDKLEPVTIKLHKVNSLGQVLEGVEFTVYEDAECVTEIAKGVTREDGNLEISGLNSHKTYYMKETKVAPGYRLPLDEAGKPIVYEICVTNIPAQGIFEISVNGQVYEDEPITIVNEIGEPLPQTGAMGVYPMVLVGLLSMHLCSYEKKKKGKRY